MSQNTKNTIPKADAGQNSVPTYRKNSLEYHFNALLPDYASFDVIAHELWNDDGCWSVNDSWHLPEG